MGWATVRILTVLVYGLQECRGLTSREPTRVTKGLENLIYCEKSSLVSLIGGFFAVWENVSGVPRGLLGDSQRVLQPYNRAVLSSHAQPMFGVATSVQTQNIPGWRSWTSQELRGKGDTFFIVKNVQKETSSFSERDLSQQLTLRHPSILVPHGCVIDGFVVQRLLPEAQPESA